MGLIAILRRIAASSVTGLTVGRHGRILMGSEISYCMSAILSNSTTTPLDKKKDILSCALFGTRGFCSDLSSSIAEVNQSILSIVDSKSRRLREEDDDDQVDELPDDFTFKIQDGLGNNRMMLEKEYDGDVINVEVQRPKTFTCYGEQDDDKVRWMCDEPGIPLIVCIYREGNGTSLEFSCMLYHDGLSVIKMIRKSLDTCKDDLTCGGLDLKNVDDYSNRVLERFLELRGINRSIYTFLKKCMVKKHCKVFLRWMRNLKNILEL